ncbi:MAG: class I SAM-dependent methyltransferase [Candidatus Verstraetearchaeota archaeon]|nr:class I SAM-dependent methyltransferase [Candidatus Verstraetearchaeota archaeon]
MISRKEIMKVFDKIANDFSIKRRKIWKSIDELAPFDGNIILDLGAGSGRNSKYVLKKGAKLVIAADFSKRMLENLLSNLGKEEKESIIPIRCDAIYLPFRSSVFDKILYIATLHHIPNKEMRKMSIKECYRVLKKGGRIIITTWSLIQMRFLRKILSIIYMYLKGYEFGDIYVPWGKEKRFYHLFTMRELKSLVRESGFIIEKAYGEKVNSKIFPENCVVIARRINHD